MERMIEFTMFTTLGLQLYLIRRYDWALLAPSPNTCTTGAPRDQPLTQPFDAGSNRRFRPTVGEARNTGVWRVTHESWHTNPSNTRSP